MATQHYELKAAFQFPISQDEALIFLEHAKTCESIIVDLREATFKKDGLAQCMQWLVQMQVISNGAIKKIIFSFDSLVADLARVDQVKLLLEKCIKGNIFFSFVPIEIVADEENLKAKSPQLFDLYQNVKKIIAARVSMLQTEPKIAEDGKALFQELRQLMLNPPH